MRLATLVAVSEPQQQQHLEWNLGERQVPRHYDEFVRRAWRGRRWERKVEVRQLEEATSHTQNLTPTTHNFPPQNEQVRHCEDEAQRGAKRRADISLSLFTLRKL